MPDYPQPLAPHGHLAQRARYVAPRLVIADLAGATHHDIEGPLYVLDLRDPTLADDRAAQRWKHPEHHADARIKHLRMMPVTDGAVVPAETIAEAVAWYRDVRAVAPDAIVVIHCYAGVSRSATVGYAILRACYGVGHIAARHRVRTREGVIAYPSDRVMAEAARWCNGQVSRE